MFTLGLALTLLGAVHAEEATHDDADKSKAAADTKAQQSPELKKRLDHLEDKYKKQLPYVKEYAPEDAVKQMHHKYEQARKETVKDYEEEQKAKKEKADAKKAEAQDDTLPTGQQAVELVEATADAPAAPAAAQKEEPTFDSLRKEADDAHKTAEEKMKALVDLVAHLREVGRNRTLTEREADRIADHVHKQLAPQRDAAEKEFKESTRQAEEAVRALAEAAHTLTQMRDTLSSAYTTARDDAKKAAEETAEAKAAQAKEEEASAKEQKEAKDTTADQAADENAAQDAKADEQDTKAATTAAKDAVKEVKKGETNAAKGQARDTDSGPLSWIGIQEQANVEQVDQRIGLAKLRADWDAKNTEADEALERQKRALDAVEKADHDEKKEALRQAHEEQKEHLRRGRELLREATKAGAAHRRISSRAAHVGMKHGMSEREAEKYEEKSEHVAEKGMDRAEDQNDKVEDAAEHLGGKLEHLLEHRSEHDEAQEKMHQAMRESRDELVKRAKELRKQVEGKSGAEAAVDRIQEKLARLQTAMAKDDAMSPNQETTTLLGTQQTVPPASAFFAAVVCGLFLALIAYPMVSRRVNPEDERRTSLLAPESP